MHVHSTEAKPRGNRLAHMSYKQFDAVMDLESATYMRIKEIDRALDEITMRLNAPTQAVEYVYDAEHLIAALRRDMELLFAIDNGTAVWDDTAKAWREGHDDEANT